MNQVEQALTFECRGETLVGILSEPEGSSPVGVLIIVGGPQYRVGSHRQFVHLARALASAGIPTLRFDYRGMGDATGEMRSFEDSSDDIAAAIATMQRQCPQVKRIVLWGLCDAASAALTYWYSALDARVSGMVLVNPWVRSEAALAKTHVKHYYSQRLLEKDFWRKLVRGDVKVGTAMKALARNVILASRKGKGNSLAEPIDYRDRMADGLRSFEGAVLLILSGRDLTAKEFLEHAQGSSRWAGLLNRTRVVRKDLVDADHTFSTASWSRDVNAYTSDWLRETLR